jgi:hypothetical protein
MTGGRRRHKGLHTGLFEGGKRTSLFTSPFTSKITVFQTSDACSEFLHSQCPRRVKMYLLDVWLVCDCACHSRTRGKREARAAATEFVRLVRPTSASRSSCTELVRSSSQYDDTTTPTVATQSVEVIAR